MTLTELLQQSSALHRHLCPRQVLGARMGMWAGELPQMALPQPDKRLLTIVETDGCFADGVAVATNCWTGHRTLRVEDYGKVAATFIDTQTGSAWRIAPTLWRARAPLPMRRTPPTVGKPCCSATRSCPLASCSSRSQSCCSFRWKA